jgi:basic membrane lipoprotein Med (substrate-binding protein (PBP1-ABC) superfamily)
MVDSSRWVVLGGVTVAVALGVASTSCRREAPPEPEPAFTVRALTSSAVSGRWERAAERGLGRIAAELDADVARLRAAGGSARRDLLVRQGRADVDLVFCVGREFERVVYTDAPAFPATRFVLVPGRAHDGNVASIDVLPAGAGFVAGRVAAALAGEARVGVLRGPGGPWLEAVEEGFVRGAADATGEMPVVVQLAAGPWGLRGEGVAVALLASDRIGRRVLAEAHDAGVLLVALDADLLGADDVVVAAIAVDLAEAMLRVAREVRDGTFRGQVYAFDLGSGVLDVELDADTAVLHPEAVEALESARAAVTAGYVEVEGLGM